MRKYQREIARLNSFLVYARVNLFFIGVACGFLGGFIGRMLMVDRFTSYALSIALSIVGSTFGGYCVAGLRAQRYQLLILRDIYEGLNPSSDREDE